MLKKTKALLLLPGGILGPFGCNDDKAPSVLLAPSAPTVPSPRFLRSLVPASP